MDRLIRAWLVFVLAACSGGRRGDDDDDDDNYEPDASTTDDCPDGTLGCDCGPGGSCDAGLECGVERNTCVGIACPIDDCPGQIWSWQGTGIISPFSGGIAIDSLDNIFVAGHMVGPAGEGDNVWFAKVDSEGALAWEVATNEATIDPDYAEPHDRADSIAVDPSGDVVISGFATTAVGIGDPWIGRYAEDGSRLWTRAYLLDLRADVATGIAVAADGDLLVVGEARPGLNANFWVARLDPGGEVLWGDQPLVGRAASMGRAIAVSPSDEVAFVGSELMSESEDWDLDILRLSPDGTLSEPQVMDSGGDDNGWAVASGGDGGFVVAGSFDGEAWMAKLDPSADVEWTTSFRCWGSGRQQATGIAVGPDGQIGVATATPRTGAETGDSFVRMFDRDGEPVWSCAAPEGRARGVAIDSTGSVVAVVADGATLIKIAAE